MSFKSAFALMLLAALSCAFDTRAGASLLIDDATITPAGRCQVESWVRAYSPGQEFTAVPACNRGDTEFGLGISRYANPSIGQQFNLGAKRLFRDFAGKPWGIGASVGATWDRDADRWSNCSASVPMSIALDSERRVVLHANLGLIKPYAQPGALNGGVGLEIALHTSWTLLAEAYGDDRGAAAAQLGLRRSIGDVASLDLIVGHQRGLENGPWLTLGFNVLLPE